MAIRKGQRTLPKGTEAHAKRFIPPKVSSRSLVPSVSHRAAHPRGQVRKGK